MRLSDWYENKDRDEIEVRIPESNQKSKIRITVPKDGEGYGGLRDPSWLPEVRTNSAAGFANVGAASRRRRGNNGLEIVEQRRVGADGE